MANKNTHTRTIKKNVKTRLRQLQHYQAQELDTLKYYCESDPLDISEYGLDRKKRFDEIVDFLVDDLNELLTRI